MQPIDRMFELLVLFILTLPLLIIYNFLNVQYLISCINQTFIFLLIKIVFKFSLYSSSNLYLSLTLLSYCLLFDDTFSCIEDAFYPTFNIRLVHASIMHHLTHALHASCIIHCMHHASHASCIACIMHLMH